VSLDPTRGSEIQKTRPCLIVSPDEINQHLRTIIVAPMTTTGRPYPTRVHLTFQGKRGQVAVDQLRAVYGQRWVRKLGKVSAEASSTADDCSLLFFGLALGSVRVSANLAQRHFAALFV
jgi:mRNA interferase MazF